MGFERLVGAPGLGPGQIAIDTGYNGSTYVATLEAKRTQVGCCMRHVPLGRYMPQLSCPALPDPTAVASFVRKVATHTHTNTQTGLAHNILLRKTAKL